MSRARFTACHLPWTADSDCACLSPGERTQKGEKTRQGMSRNPPQRRNVRARNGVALKRPGSITAGLVRAAHPFTDAASVMLNLRQCDGSPTGRRRFTGSVYDSAGSRQGSRPQADTTGRKTDRTAISASTPSVWPLLATTTTTTTTTQRLSTEQEYRRPATTHRYSYSDTTGTSGTGGDTRRRRRGVLRRQAEPARVLRAG